MKNKIEHSPKDCIRANSGIFVNVFKPKADMFKPEDMAHSLAIMPRFAGHLTRRYSVAQHCINCCNLASKKNKLAALLHDAPEAYLLDIPTPIKAKLPFYKKVENGIMAVIAKTYGIQFPFDSEIKEIDKKMLDIEWENLMVNDNPDFVVLTPFQAKKQYLKLFYELTKNMDSLT